MGRCHGRYWKLKQREREKVSASFHGTAKISRPPT
jgi:hypothetical protein